MGRRPADINALRTECWEDIVLRLPPSEIPLIRLVILLQSLILGFPIDKHLIDRSIAVSASSLITRLRSNIA